MEYPFVYNNPTKIYFGQGSLKHLSDELEKAGPVVLLAYGRSSIKKMGLYDQVALILQKAGKRVVDFPDIMANPTWEKVEEGIALVKKNQVNFVLAVGGGSVIDCAKAVCAFSFSHGDAWERFLERHEKIDNEVIPLGTVLTMVGTGSEMDAGSVISNDEKKIKTSFGDDRCFPRFSILDPEYTYSVPKYQMVSGAIDILSHIMEQYFSPDDGDNVSDDLAEALFKNVMRNLLIAIEKPTDYEARSNLMWDASLALCGILECSKRTDWEVHSLEHQVSAYTDCAHGMGLAVISPAYYRHICQSGLSKFRRFAINVFGVDPKGKSDSYIALEGIADLAKFFKAAGAPTTLRELGVKDEAEAKAIADGCAFNDGGYKVLTKEDAEAIFKECF